MGMCIALLFEVLILGVNRRWKKLIVSLVRIFSTVRVSYIYSWFLELSNYMLSILQKSLKKQILYSHVACLLFYRTAFNIKGINLNTKTQNKVRQRKEDWGNKNSFSLEMVGENKSERVWLAVRQMMAIKNMGPIHAVRPQLLCSASPHSLIRVPCLNTLLFPFISLCGACISWSRHLRHPCRTLLRFMLSDRTWLSAAAK